jgi:hypothetical protein
MLNSFSFGAIVSSQSSIQPIGQAGLGGVGEEVTVCVTVAVNEGVPAYGVFVFVNVDVTTGVAVPRSVGDNTMFFFLLHPSTTIAITTKITSAAIHTFFMTLSTSKNILKNTIFLQKFNPCKGLYCRSKNPH